jgi:tripartite-type tricarboxylate transporter receptor subunit TctC
MRKRFALLAAVLLALSPGVSTAQDFPSKPIRLISPFPPGSGPDVMMRVVADRAAQQLKQPLVLEPRTGGAGIPAMEAIKAAAPDGYLLGIASDQNLTILPFLNRALPYDPQADFTPVMRIFSSPYFVMVAAKGPYATLRDLIADARSAPNKVSYGGAAVGSQSHLGGSLFASLIKAQMVFVPYRDFPQMFNGIASGDLGWTLSTAASASAFLQNGTIKILAIAQKTRSPQFSDIPTVAEAGGPEFESAPWLALIGPRGIPPAIVQQINAAVTAALTDGTVQDRLRQFGFTAHPSSPQELVRHIEADTKRNRELVRQSGAAAP